MAPLMCERLLCGQKHKTMLQLDLPPSFVGRQFVDVFRAFLSKNLYILALRRGSSVRDKSLLPYVCTCPKYSTELRKGKVNTCHTLLCHILIVTVTPNLMKQRNVVFLTIVI